MPKRKDRHCIQQVAADCYPQEESLQIMITLEHRAEYNNEMLSQNRHRALWWGGSINVILQQGRYTVPLCAVTLHEHTV